MPRKISLYSFRRKYGAAPFTNVEYAELIIMQLVESEPLVAAARSFLEAHNAFESALEEAKIERG